MALQNYQHAAANKGCESCILSSRYLQLSEKWEALNLESHTLYT